MLHVAYWLGYVLLVLAGLAFLLARIRRPGSVWASPLTGVLLVTFVAPGMLAFYASQAVIFPRLGARRPWPEIVGPGALISGASGFLAFAILYGGAGAPRVALGDIPALAALFACLAAVAAVHAALALALRGFIAWYGDLRAREEESRLTHALELKLLQSRLDPHFLFNTLNNIDVLMARDAPAASEYLQKLSDLMRYVLFDASVPLVPLATELDHMRRYIELEGLRHGDSAFASFTVEGSPDGRSLPPTLFMPFVENAFKHSPRDPRLPVRVACEIGGGRVVFTCRNSALADRARDTAPGGIGLGLARSRLELLYPGTHKLELGPVGEEFHVRLSIPDRANLLPDS